MPNFETRKVKPISEIILSKNFDPVKVPLFKTTLYKADEVDPFLTHVAAEVENLEKASKRLYQFYENNKNSRRVAESNAGSGEQTKESADDVELRQVQRSKEQRMDRMQKQMQELLEEAANKADAIVVDAELEKDQILEQARAQAEKIISDAQRSAFDINRTAEEKIKEAKLVKYEINQRAQEIQNEIVSKANELDGMMESFSIMSQKLRGLVKERTA